MKIKTIEILFVLNEEGMKIVLENNIFDINDIVPKIKHIEEIQNLFYPKPVFLN